MCLRCFCNYVLKFGRVDCFCLIILLLHQQLEKNQYFFLAEDQTLTVLMFFENVLTSLFLHFLQFDWLSNWRNNPKS